MLNTTETADGPAPGDANVILVSLMPCLMPYYANGHRIDLSFAVEGTGETYALPADMLFTAIGQTFVAGPVSDGGDALDLNGGRIQVDAEGATSVAGVFAGGDCVSGEDLTVQAVEDGKVAAFAIDRYLRD